MDDACLGVRGVDPQMHHHTYDNRKILEIHGVDFSIDSTLISKPFHHYAEKEPSAK